ncbi:MAG: dipeptide epimerase [Bacteroidota bacterium]
METRPLWEIQQVRLPLKYTWKISRNASDEKVNLVVRHSFQDITGYGEAAPNVRYGESPDLLLTQFEEFTHTHDRPLESEAEIQSILDRSGMAYSLRFAIESAWMHRQACNRRSSLIAMLDIPEADHLATSYTVPIMDPGKLHDFLNHYRLHRFPIIKLKVDRLSAGDLLKELFANYKGRVLLDANEAFTDVDDCIRFLEGVRKMPLELVEQPLPSRLTQEATYMKKYSPFPLFADEAVTHEIDMESVSSAYHGVNMKLMKAGGYRRGLEILRAAKQYGLKTMVGCMVETTLGISSAMHLAGLADYTDLDSFLLLEHEPFGMISEKEGKLSFIGNQLDPVPA